jgi:hypothetical protein
MDNASRLIGLAASLCTTMRSLRTTYAPLVTKGVIVMPAANTRFKKGGPFYFYLQVYDRPTVSSERPTAILHLQIVDAKTGRIVKQLDPADRGAIRDPGQSSDPDWRRNRHWCAAKGLISASSKSDGLHWREHGLEFGGVQHSVVRESPESTTYEPRSGFSRPAMRRSEVSTQALREGRECARVLRRRLSHAALKRSVT